MKHILVAGVFAVCALGINIPSDAHADTNTSSVRSKTSVEVINARLESLTKMIDDLKKRLEDIKKGTGTTTSATSTPKTNGPRGKVCERLDAISNYQRGSRGDGVRWMQEYLAEEGYLPGDSATGFFGEATERGLKNWQSKYGVISGGEGHGWFGKKTREAMKKRCRDTHDTSTTTPAVSRSLRLSPESGKTPLTVQVAGVPSEVLTKMNECVYSVGRMGSSGNGLTVDWGDGTNSPTANASSSGQSCTQEVKKHTYTMPGTYTVTVRSWHPGPTDAPVTDWQGTAQVTVKATSTTIERPISKYIRPATKAREALADKLDVKVKNVKVTKVEAKEWSDGCLGLGGAAESCAAVITPGYRVTMTSGTTTYYARTDKTGSVVRIEE